jgi:hypothetical protein
VYESGIIKKMHYRPSKRTTMLAYESALTSEERQESLRLAEGNILPESIVDDVNKSEQSKRYILEAASELNQYNYMNAKVKKEEYLKFSRSILSQRSLLGKGDKLQITQPDNPLKGHQATRITAQTGWRNKEPVQFLGWRPANHDLLDSDVGYLRGTQIEFLDVLLRYEDKEVELEKLTLLSISSIAQRTEFFKPFSWRMKSGWDTNYLNKKSRFMTSIGAGLSWGNELGYVYFMVDPLFYYSTKFDAGLGGSIGMAVYENKMFKTNLEGTHRIYDNGQKQWIGMFSQNIRLNNNLALKLQYDYVQKETSVQNDEWNTFKLSLDYFF